MKKVLFAILLSGLIPTALLAPTSGSVRAAHSVSTSDLLRAHGFSQDPNVGTNYAFEAVKVSPYDGSPDGKKHNFFVEKVSVSVQAGTYRYDIASLKAPLSESYLFDGTMYHHAAAGRKELVSTAKETGDEMSQFAESRVRTFGILPFLQQLSDPRTEAVYLGRTTFGDKVEVRSVSGRWALFSDESGLVRRIEVGRGAFVFSDFRPVENILLPFNQRVFVNDTPFYELGFTRIDLRPKFRKDFFDASDLSRQVAR